LVSSKAPKGGGRRKALGENRSPDLVQAEARFGKKELLTHGEWDSTRYGRGSVHCGHYRKEPDASIEVEMQIGWAENVASKVS